MHGMASGAINNLAVHCILPIVNHHGPYVDEGEQDNIGVFIERKHKGKDVIRYTLSKTIYGMESMAGKRRWNHPLMMCFVQSLVDQRMVEAPVNPVDQEIGKSYEERELDVIIPSTRSFARAIVHPGEAAQFGHKARNGQEGHARKAPETGTDLLSDLPFQELGMVEG